jgi:flagellin
VKTNQERKGENPTMGIIINTNIQSISSQRLLNVNTMHLAKSYEKLSSGLKINRSSDDAAGLQISERLRSQIRGSQRALDNTQDGINVLSVVDGTFQTVVENLQRMRELSVQGANDSNSSQERSAINIEITQLSADLNRIAIATQFNKRNLLNGSITNYYLQVGANSNSQLDRIDIANVGGINPFSSIAASALFNLSAGSSLRVNTNSSALNSISKIDTALARIGNRRATLGAMINRLESSSKNLSIAIENLSGSESRIRNTDIAKESAEMTKYQILQQASAQVLSQSNQLPQLALKLLQ